MSFITCCPSCGTKFRVVADQLRISDGWVRCGRCQEVFDAQQALTSVAAPAPAPAAPSMQAAQPMTGAQQVQPRGVSHPAEAAQHQAPAAEAATSSAAALPPASSRPFVQADGVVPQPIPAMVVPQPAPSASPPSVAPAVQVAPPMDDRPVTPAVAAPAVSGYELPVPPEEPEADFEELLQALPPAHDDWLDLPTQVSADAPHAGAALASSLAAQRKEPSLAVALDSEEEPLLRPPAAAQPAAQSKPWEPEKALHAEESQAGIWVEVVRFIHPPKPAEPALDGHLHDAEQTQESEQVAGAASVPPVDVALDAEQVPSFVKQAQRRAWWNKPGVRFVLGMLLVFLPLALVLQIAVHERNRLAAWKPQWRDGLQNMCVLLRCEITPYRDIHAVVLTGSAFAQDALPNHYKLDLSMQNQAALSVATPAVELTLTDAQGQVLVRKVLQPTEIGAPAELAGRGEWNGTLPVKTQGLNLPVSGYRVTAFYP